MQTKKFVRHRHSASERTQLLELCERSGLTRQGFAAQHGISLSTLYQWRRQNHRSASAGQSKLIEVPNLFGHGPAAAPYRLHLPGGRLLDLARGFDLDEVRALSQLLQSL
jgi:hypothetical protein